MPCWITETVSVEFKLKHKELLKKSLTASGLRFQEYRNKIYLDNDRLVLDLETQTASVRDNDYNLLNKIKRSYSEAAIREVSLKKKFIVKKISEGNFRLRRY